MPRLTQLIPDYASQTITSNEERKEREGFISKEFIFADLSHFSYLFLSQRGHRRSPRRRREHEITTSRDRRRGNRLTRGVPRPPLRSLVRHIRWNFQIRQRTYDARTRAGVHVLARLSEEHAWQTQCFRNSVLKFPRADAATESKDAMPHQIYYSDKYYDDKYEYRYVGDCLGKSPPMTERGPFSFSPPATMHDPNGVPSCENCHVECPRCFCLISCFNLILFSSLVSRCPFFPPSVRHAGFGPEAFKNGRLRKFNRSLVRSSTCFFSCRYSFQLASLVPVVPRLSRGRMHLRSVHILPRSLT